MRHTIFSNDICGVLENIEDNLEDYFPEMEEDDLEGITDEAKYEMACDEIAISLECEKDILNKDVNGKIVLMGTIERWNGPRSAYKLLDTKNIGEALEESMESFDGDNTIEIYVEDGHMYLSQLGHDNPINPSIIEFRELTADFDELEDDLPKTLRKHSKSIAPIVYEAYGWEEACA